MKKIFPRWFKYVCIEILIFSCDKNKPSENTPKILNKFETKQYLDKKEIPQNIIELVCKKIGDKYIRVDSLTEVLKNIEKGKDVDEIIKSLQVCYLNENPVLETPKNKKDIKIEEIKDFFEKLKDVHKLKEIKDCDEILQILEEEFICFIENDKRTEREIKRILSKISTATTEKDLEVIYQQDFYRGSKIEDENKEFLKEFFKEKPSEEITFSLLDFDEIDEKIYLRVNTNDESRSFKVDLKNLNKYIHVTKIDQGRRKKLEKIADSIDLSIDLKNLKDLQEKLSTLKKATLQQIFNEIKKEKIDYEAPDFIKKEIEQIIIAKLKKIVTFDSIKTALNDSQYLSKKAVIYNQQQLQKLAEQFFTGFNIPYKDLNIVLEDSNKRIKTLDFKINTHFEDSSSFDREGQIIIENMQKMVKESIVTYNREEKLKHIFEELNNTDINSIKDFFDFFSDDKIKACDILEYTLSQELGKQTSITQELKSFFERINNTKPFYSINNFPDLEERQKSILEIGKIGKSICNKIENKELQPLKDFIKYIVKTDAYGNIKWSRILAYTYFDKNYNDTDMKLINASREKIFNNTIGARQDLNKMFPLNSIIDFKKNVLIPNDELKQENRISKNLIGELRNGNIDNIMRMLGNSTISLI